MTRIKDPVTVIVDSAFSLFPVDLERYDLEVSVLLMATHPRAVMKEYSHVNERINSFLLETDALLCRNAIAHSEAFYGYNTLPPDDRDRARRVEASLSEYALGWEGIENHERYVWENTRKKLWMCLAYALEQEERRVKRLSRL